MTFISMDSTKENTTSMSRILHKLLKIIILNFILYIIQVYIILIQLMYIVFVVFDWTRAQSPV